MLYLSDPARVRRVLLADGWHDVSSAGLRLTAQGVSWRPADDDRLTVYAAKDDVLAVEEWTTARP